MSVALHHEVAGPEKAPPLLLGSSLGTTAAIWDPKPMAERLRAIRYDHRGHGGSPVPPGPYEIADLGHDVVALMDRLGIERSSLAGVSLGGMVAMWVGAHAPERVDRLVLCCTSARLAGPWAERAAVVRAAGSTEPIADAVVERWLTPPYAAAHPQVLARLRAMLISTDPGAYAECCGAIERMDLTADLPRISAPTLVISGACDPATPPEHQRVIAQAIPHARHEIVGPAAHLAPVEQSAAVTHLIIEHLEAQ